MDGGDAVLGRDGDRLVPRPLARGPWSPDALHGGVPAAVLARAVERFDPGPTGFVARLTVDLLRPVPFEPLVVEVERARRGRSVEHLDAVLEAGGVAVARARALRLREVAGLDLSGAVTPPAAPALPPPDACPVVSWGRDPVRSGFFGAWECRSAHGGFGEPGPGAAWFRLRVPLVEGERPSPFERLAAVSDFGSGVGSTLGFSDRQEWLFINPDLTVARWRVPVGDWLALHAGSWARAEGTGMAETVLADERGPVGRAVQTILVDRLEG